MKRLQEKSVDTMKLSKVYKVMELVRGKSSSLEKLFRLRILFCLTT